MRSLRSFGSQAQSIRAPITNKVHTERISARVQVCGCSSETPNWPPGCIVSCNLEISSKFECRPEDDLTL